MIRWLFEKCRVGSVTFKLTRLNVEPGVLILDIPLALSAAPMYT